MTRAVQPAVAEGRSHRSALHASLSRPPLNGNIVRQTGRLIVTAEDVAELVRNELRRITDKKVVAAIEPMLVAPRCEERPWDYGGAEHYPCWVVLEHPASNTGIAYCAEGFGPRCPWGLLFLRGHLSMGMDSGWFSSLEDAFRDSMASDS
jgi:hypothetical protein